MNGKYISCATLIDRLYQDFGWDITLNWSDAIEWVGRSLEQLKVPGYYTTKVTDGNKELGHPDYIEINEHRGKLPCDLLSIRQTACVQECFSNCPKTVPIVTGIVYIDYTTGQTCTTGECNSLCADLLANPQCVPCNPPHANNTCGCTSNCCTGTCGCGSCSRVFLPMRWSTNTFQLGFHGTDLDFRCNSELTYTVNNNYIFTSFRKGKIAMAYNAIPTDELGLPLIPDSESVKEYVTWYIGTKIAFQLYLQDKYTRDKYEEFKSYLSLYFMKAKNEGKMPQNLDEWQSYANQRIRSIPKFFEHSNFFSHLQAPEQRWNHPTAASMYNNYSFNLVY